MSVAWIPQRSHTTSLFSIDW